MHHPAMATAWWGGGGGKAQPAKPHVRCPQLLGHLHALQGHAFARGCHHHVHRLARVDARSMQHEATKSWAGRRAATAHRPRQPMGSPRSGTHELDSTRHDRGAGSRDSTCGAHYRRATRPAHRHAYLGLQAARSGGLRLHDGKHALDADGDAHARHLCRREGAHQVVIPTTSRNAANGDTGLCSRKRQSRAVGGGMGKGRQPCK
jgi:hypothetical protein